MTDVPSGGPASAAGPGDPVGDVPTDDPVADVPPGGVVTADDPVPIAQGRERTELRVENAGDRPVQVGSHFHFFEVNPALAFDREAAYGFRLAAPAGTAVRFEPGQEQTVELVAFGGDRVVRGFAGLVDGPLDDEQVRERALERAAERGYLEHDPERGDAAGTDGDGGATGSDDGGASGSETSGATGSDAGEATDSEVDDG